MEKKKLNVDFESIIAKNDITYDDYKKKKKELYSILTCKN